MSPLGPLTTTKCQVNPRFTDLKYEQSGNPHIDTKLDNKKAPVQFEPKHGAF